MSIGKTAGVTGAGTLSLPDPGAEFFTLPNGLQLIVREDHSAPLVSTQLWCRTGSIHEGGWLGAGLSHFVEHMLFKGTPSRHYSEIASGIQAAGGYVNAYTSFDRTVYYTDSPTSGAATCLEILTDAFCNSSFPEEEFAKEQEVIRREFAMGADDPGRNLSRLLFSNAFRRHPYRLPVIGHLDLFNQLTRDDLYTYYRGRYTPDNAFVVVVGDVTAHEVRDQLQALTCEWQRAPLLPDHVPEEPPQRGRRDAHEEFNTEAARISMAWHVPGTTAEDLPALDLLATALGTGRSSRLYRNLREDQGIAHSAYAHLFSQESAGLFMVGGDTEPEHRQAFIDSALSEVERLCDQGLREDEVDKARKISLADLLDNLTTMRGQADDLGSSWLNTGSLRFTNDYLEALTNLTSADLKEVAKRYLGEQNLTVASLSPEGTLKTQAPEIHISQTPSLHRFELSNGLPLIVQRDARLPLVSAQAAFLGGVLAEDEGQAGLCHLTARMLMKGAGERDASAIADAIENEGGSIGTDSGNNSIGASLDVLRDDLSQGLGIFSDLLIHPTFPETALEAERASMISRVKEAAERPMSAALREVRGALYPGHPFANNSAGLEADLRSFQCSDLSSFAERHINAGSGALAVFGDVDPEAVQDLAEEHFAALQPASEAGKFVPNTKTPEPPKGKEISLTLDREQAVLIVAYPSIPLEHPDRMALDLLDEACSDMASPLFTRIREEMGLAYYVGSGQLLGLAPGAFYFYVGTDPQQVEAVREALLSEISKIAKGGISNEEIERARATLLSKYLLQSQSLDSLATSSALDEIYGLGHDRFLSAAKRIEAITPKQVQTAAAHYLGGTPAVTVSVNSKG